MRIIFGFILIFLTNSLFALSEPINNDLGPRNQNQEIGNQKRALQQRNYRKYRNYTNKFKITLLAGTGTTAVNDGLSANSQENIYGGLQFLYTADYRNVIIGIGLELGRHNIYQFSTYSHETAEEFINVYFTGEVTLMAIDWFGMMFQFGIGPMIGISSTDDVYYASQYSMGLVFKPLDFFTIQPMVRSEWIFLTNNQIVGAFSAQLGLGFHIDLD